MMGSGKTSVGELVSRQLGSYTFLDTDATLEAATKRTVADIFEKDGEAAFRELEGSIMEQVAAYVRLVVASAQIKFRGASHCGIMTCTPSTRRLRDGVAVRHDVCADVVAVRCDWPAQPRRTRLTG